VEQRAGIEAAVDAAGGPVGLAARVGVSVATVYHWLAVGGVPYTAWAARVAAETGVALSTLVPAGPPPRRWRGSRRPLVPRMPP
jgi:hypothetical protein